MRKMQDVNGLDQLIEAGSTGYFPLFYQDWIHESLHANKEMKKISFSMAAETVHRVYKQIECHRSIERKKTAIGALPDKDRNDFVISFMKMVEYRTLDRLKELH